MMWEQDWWANGPRANGFGGKIFWANELPFVKTTGARHDLFVFKKIDLPYTLIKGKGDYSIGEVNFLEDK